MDFHTPAVSATFRHLAPRGFALVVTLTLMVLLSILALGLLSLSSVELRASGERQRTELARQNALLALKIAIGELQKNLGPDRRTSATAELISPAFETTNRYWTGAWNTQGGFRGWLISGNENLLQPGNPAADVAAIPCTPEVKATASSSHSTGFALGAKPAVLLVGENTISKSVSSAEKDLRKVFAPVIDVKSGASGQVTGRYAWWVGDEGVKANLAANVVDLPSSGGVEKDLKFLSSSPNRGFPTLGGDWATWIPGAKGAPQFENLDGKLISQKQIAVASSQLAEDSRFRFHDFTVSSAGVMSDSKRGGLKKDLSIAFEIPEKSFVNSEFTRVLGEGDETDAYATNHSGRIGTNAFSGRSTKTASNYRDDSWPTGFNFRGPTFDQLRDHYQLYRRINDPMSASASIGAQTAMPNGQATKGGKNKTRSPSGDYFGEARDFPTGNNPEVTDTYKDGSTSFVRLRPMTNEFVPELIRYTYTLAIQSFQDPKDPNQYFIRLIYTPFIVLQNPYNVAITSPAMWMKIQRAELHARFEYTVGTTKTSTVWPEQSADVNLRSMLQAEFGDDNNISGDSLAYDSIDYFLSDNGSASGTISMKPGETKLFTLRGSTTIPADQVFVKDKNRNVFMQSGLEDLFSTGLYVTVRARTGWHTTKEFKVPKGTNFDVSVNNKLEGRPTAANEPVMGFDMPEFKTIWTKLVPPGVSEPVPNGAHQGWNQIRLIQFYANDYWTGKLTGTAASKFKPEDIEASPSGPRRYIGREDVYLKPTNDGTDRDNNMSLATHNPRAMVQSTLMSGAQGPASLRGPATWTASVKRLDPGSSSTPGFDSRFWGSGTTSSTGGQRTLVLYDIPRAPLTSIASFQNANISRLGINPAFAVGNSYASPYVPADRLWWRSSTSPPSYSNNTNYWIIDNSYVFNEDLFDSYFFSGVHPGFGSSQWNNPLSAASVSLGSADTTQSGPIQNSIDNWKSGTAPLLNPRHRFILPAGRSSADADDDLNIAKRYATAQTTLSKNEDIRPHNSIAGYLLNRGAFNINSVSVDAWRVQLAGLRGAAVHHFSTPVTLSSDSKANGTPFPRSTMPGAGSSTGSDEELWNGFRNLDDEQIETLAREIVSEIKNRARNRPSGASARPFTTLGEFVNRRTVSAGNPFSRKGALQAAIDRSINSTPIKLSGQKVIAADKNHATAKTGTSTETNSLPYENLNALAEATIAATPQWLTQADLLENLGPQISARSDTFTIRAYGESVNPRTGRLEGRAWLEAIVQRGTSYMDPKDHPALPPEAFTLSKVSKEYGRRFTIVSLRWLTPGDI